VYLAWRLWQSVLRLAGSGNSNSGRVFSASEVAGFRGASIAVHRKSTGHTISELSWNYVFFCVFSVAVMEKCFEACGSGE
jgi:hypothetical protein